MAAGMAKQAVAAVRHRRQQDARASTTSATCSTRPRSASRRPASGWASATCRARRSREDGLTGRQGDVRVRRRPPAQPEQPAGRGDADAAAALRARSRRGRRTRRSASASRTAGPRPTDAAARRAAGRAAPGPAARSAGHGPQHVQGRDDQRRRRGRRRHRHHRRTEARRLARHDLRPRLRAAPQRPDQVLGAAGHEAGRRLHDRRARRSTASPA